MLKKALKQFSENRFIVILILLGSLSWCLTMIKSGVDYNFGLGFWGPNGHDGIWHISLINSLARGSLDMPVFSGVRIQNYHIGFDLLLAILHSLSRIPTAALYFQIIPPLIALWTGVLTYKFVLLWRNSKNEALWATFFVYFGGSLGWIVNIFRGQEIGGESMFWSQQSVSTLLNPPFALSLIFILLGLIFLLNLLKKPSFTYLFLSILMFGTLIEIKSYAGVLVLGSLLLSGIWDFLTSKRTNILQVFIFSFLLSLVLFVPLNGFGVGLLLWQPFWFLETMLALSDRFYWPKLYEATMNYKDAHNYLKLLPAYFVTFLIFWFGNMWTRTFKEMHIFVWLKNIRKVGHMDVFLASIIIFGGVLPMFFVQKGTPWNTIQFFYYSLIFSGIFSGIAVSEFLKNKQKKFVLISSVLIILLTIPTTLTTLLHHYLPSRPPAKISTSELEALNFLARQPQGVVLTYPFDAAAAAEAVANPPRPLYLYDSTAYVSAYGNKPVFVEDQVNLDITGFDWRGRRLQVEKFLKSQSMDETRKFLHDNNIKYIYWVKPQRAVLGETQLGITPIFENKEVYIYQVN